MYNYLLVKCYCEDKIIEDIYPDLATAQAAMRLDVMNTVGHEVFMNEENRFNDWDVDELTAYAFQFQRPQCLIMWKIIPIKFNINVDISIK